MFGLSPELEGVITGLSVSAANTAVGVWIAKYSMTKPVKQTVSIILGGMTARLFAMAIVVWICIAVVEIHQLSFALSLMISFFLMLMIETFFFHRSHERNKTPYVRKKRVRFPELD
ncbi:MAG: hypothetical protein JNJ85_09375 [Candidatus Kapabacteria bacterium]|nr:hypothetical protein [Candidatus Kapabacteria bacterium]MBX7154477.1 hypothetical protein [Bacteroidota bacterium]